MTRRGRASLVATAALIVAALPVYQPQLLAFPHRANIGTFRIWSVAPIDDRALRPIIAAATARIDASPIADPPERRDLFLTDGGWRWRWLALSSSGAFAVTRPATDNIVINRTNVHQNAVVNGRAIGGRRTLASVIAHETAHAMIVRHFGLIAAASAPTWLREGYCDHVAGESSLSAADYAALKAAKATHPALVYYEGRQRVAQLLAANGGSVDRLFAEAQ